MEAAPIVIEKKVTEDDEWSPEAEAAEEEARLARIEAEKARFAEEKDNRAKLRADRLEHFAETFYSDLNHRMESFFNQDAARKEAARGIA